VFARTPQARDEGAQLFWLAEISTVLSSYFPIPPLSTASFAASHAANPPANSRTSVIPPRSSKLAAIEDR
jgi:hypothetical protein